MNTTKTVATSHNPFRSRLHRQLKGQYVPSDITTDRHIMLLESMVDFERERWRQIEAERRNEPHNPF